MTKRDTAALRRAVDARPYCRTCGTTQGLDAHHIVPRRVTQCDDQENLVVLCRNCHNAVHNHDLELGSHLDTAEQAKAVLLTGSLTLAMSLLYPKSYSRATSGVGWPE